MISESTAQAIKESSGITQSIEAIQEAFAKNKAAVALPSDFKIHDLEQYLPNRRRATGAMITSVFDDFATYVSDHKEPGVNVFVNQDRMQAVAVLNLGTPEAPGHADNFAVLGLKKTAAYSALLVACTDTRGATMTQRATAEFLEDWANLIQCSNDEGNISIPHAVSAIRKLTIEAMRNIESEEQSLSASKSSFEQVSAKSKEHPIPTLINFTCTPYHGLSERTFTMRLGILTGGDIPNISLRIIKEEEHAEAMAEELAERTRTALGDSLADAPVLIGSYSSK